MTKATSAAEKLIVFDWGDVIEYHGAYSCYSLRALSYILKHMGLPCDQTAVREFIDLLYANGILTKGKDTDLAAMVKAIYLHYNRPCYDGMVTDFTHIKRIVKDTFDHKYINEILDVNPSSENIARWICDHVENCYKVSVQESEGNIATYER